MVVVDLVVMLLLIVVAAEVFTNALEHLGERLGISEGVTGSLFAAVGTAMPESLVPILAIFAGTENQQVNHEIGVGAILGAPLMLSTLTMCLMGIAVVRERGLRGALLPEPTGLARDLNFFLLSFGIALLALFIPFREGHLVLTTMGGSLVLVYFIYVMLTLRVSAQLVQNGHGTEAHRPLFLCYLRLPDAMVVIFVQLVLGLALLIAGAEGFIHAVEVTSREFDISALLLSLLIVPIATELPEKVNSILWIRRRKDTLAFGNITGAMVFQGSVLPAIGILLTPWQLRSEVLVVVLVTYAAALWLRYNALRGHLRVWMLFVSGGLYVAYLAIMLL
ncbi:MAG: sodium:calcium antiporter [Gammaproteobacteria bacterium]